MGNPNRQSLVAGPAVARTMLTLAVALLLNLGFAGQIHAQTYSVIHNFVGSFDGSEPASGVTVDAAGNLYGSTFFGDQATGTVYKLARRSGGWVLFPLMYFTNMATGVIPYDQPVFGPDGAIYLTTGFGGVGPCFTYNNTTGCGVMMTLKPLPTPPPTPLTPWNETLLYKFTGGADGGNPYSATILFDGPTNIYSTTFMGGSSLCSGGCGVVYKMTKTNGTWSENVLYTFTNGSDGAHPWSGLTADHSGNFYGTTSAGGTGGFGTVFELSPNGSGGWNLRTLYSFTGQDDGGTPFSGLTFDASGNLFGATSAYGPGNGGTIYELTPAAGGNWNFQTVFTFTGPRGGIQPGPLANLTFDAQGNMYGTTHLDGPFNFGAIFKLTPGSGGWTYTSLHDFTGGLDGGYPRSVVAFDASGNMYGTASEGGTGNRTACVGPCGVIWQIAAH